MSDNESKHVFMDEELVASLRKEFERLAEQGVIGDPEGTLAYAYLRVSSRGQAQEGRSGLPRQLEHVAEEARKEGLAIPWDLVYCDDHSGFSFEDRPGLNALLKEVRRKPRAHKLVMEYPDRMSRSHEWHYGFIREQFQKSGVEYVYWQGYHSEIERSVMGTMSEQGMRQALERMHYGTLKKARSGRVTAKTPAYGYKFVDSQGRDRTDPKSQWRKDKHYAIVEEQAEIMRLIYRRLAYEGDTLLAITNYLNEMQVAPPKRSAHWEQTLLSKMVKNSGYKGEFTAHRWYYKKVWSKRSRRMTICKFQRPREEWIIVPVPRIVSPATWDLAQETLARNRTLSTRNMKYDFLLAHLIVCAECRHSFTLNTKLYRKKGKLYLSPCYRCVGKTCQVRVVRERIGCTQSQISAKKLDPVVWNVIVNLLTEPYKLVAALEKYYASTKRASFQSQLEFIDQQITQRQSEDEKLYRAYVKGAFDEQEYADRRREIKNAIQALQGERGKLLARIVSEEDIQERKQMLSDVADRVRCKLHSMDIPFEIKRRVVRMLIDHIEMNVNEGWFTIYGILRGTFSIDTGEFVNTPGDMGSSPKSASRSPERSVTRWRG
jgi:site-specific DNA recombinase